MTRLLPSLPALLGLALWLPAAHALPGNDDFDDAFTLNGASAGSNEDASMEGGEPNITGQSDRSVWWNWTPAVSATVSIDTFGSDFDTVLGVFTGASVNSLSLTASNDDSADIPGTAQSRVTFAASAGTTYRVQVSGFLAEAGTVHLYVTPVAPPPNDAFANAVTLANLSTGTNRFASQQPSEVSNGFGGTKSVWWNWTAPETAKYTFSTEGIDFRNVLGIYTGTAVDNLTPLPDDRFPGLDAVFCSGPTSMATSAKIQAQRGTTYRIGVWGLDSEEGTVQLSVSADPPANDALASSKSLFSDYPVTGESVELGGATLQTSSGEPSHGGASTRSAWWSWTAPPFETGLLTVDTTGSDIDTILDVFRGTDWNHLVRTNDNSGPSSTSSRVSFLVEPSQPYRIRVTDNALGVPSGCGRVVLNLTFTSLTPLFEQYCQALPPMEQAPENDPDRDSFTNLAEFIFGLDPAQPDAPARAFARGTVTHDPFLGTAYFTVTLQRRQDMNTRYIVAVSDDLVNWDTSEIDVEQVGSAVPNADGFTETATYRITSNSPEGRRFVRIEASIPTP